MIPKQQMSLGQKNCSAYKKKRVATDIDNFNLKRDREKQNLIEF